MRVPRALLGALLWILASVIGLVAVLLCITLVLLPLGIPLLALARRMFTRSIRLFMPPAAVHPFSESAKSTKQAAGKAQDRLSSIKDLDVGKARKRLKKTWHKARHA